MSASDEYIVRYHHGWKLINVRSLKYENGKIYGFGVDMNKICYWDMLGDIHVLGYDINKSVNLFYIDGDKTLKQIFDDSGIVGIAGKYIDVDVYVESTCISHKRVLP